MKLLKKVKPIRNESSRIRENNTSLIERGHKIAELVDKNEKRLNSVKTELVDKTEHYQSEFDVFFSSLSQAKQKLLDEVSVVLKEKQEALKSIENLRGGILYERGLFEELRNSAKEGSEREQASLGKKMAEISALMEQLALIVGNAKLEHEGLKQLENNLELKVTQLNQLCLKNDKQTQVLKDLYQECEVALKDREDSVKGKEQAQEVLWDSLQAERGKLEQDKLKVKDQQKALKADYDHLRSKNLL